MIAHHAHVSKPPKQPSKTIARKFPNCPQHPSLSLFCCSVLVSCASQYSRKPSPVPVLSRLWRASGIVRLINNKQLFIAIVFVAL